MSVSGPPLSPEHANLTADEIMTIFGRQPAVPFYVRFTPPNPGPFASSRHFGLDCNETYGNPVHRTVCRNTDGFPLSRRHLTVFFRLEQKTIEFLAMDYDRPEVCPQPDDPGERSVYAAESIER
jgi:hypothetical protein